MSSDQFSTNFKIGLSTINDWQAMPDRRPQSGMQRVLDRVYEEASQAVRDRFAELTAEAVPAVAAPDDSMAADAEQRLTADPNIVAALDWLDQHVSGWEPGTARREVAARMARLDPRELRDTGSRRSQASRSSIAQALADYYATSTDGHGRYCAHYGDNTEIETSVLTGPDWLDLDCPLIATHDRLKVSGTTAGDGNLLDVSAADHAAWRLAGALASGVRLINMPLYRLIDIDIRKQQISGVAEVDQFVAYALTMDLLEGELADALALGTPPRSGSLPLRDRYLPDLASVLDVSGRICAGGTLALCAFARPADPFRGEADYVLLVQERSSHVLNAAGRLAVIPKGFHQPMTDIRADVRIGATLRREMEEEFFGREETDNTVSHQRRADPMHPSRLTEPMRWLMGEPGRLRMECTGFGLNLVSGNYEFPALIVVDDEEFWTQYGGLIEANWESSTLRQYSSLDADLLGELITEVGWSNEGLFALLQGLRRLAQIGGDRVNVPTIDWELR
jgi:hypothetical protein